MSINRRVRYSVALGLSTVFLLVAGYGTYLLTTPLDYRTPLPFTGHGKFVNSDGTNTTILLAEETFTARGCFCATNTITVQVIFKNATGFTFGTLKRYNAFAFTHSQNVPAQPAGAGFDTSPQTGELALFEGQGPGFMCPAGAMCVKGDLMWPQEGDTWGYFIVNTTVHGMVDTALVSKGERDLHVDSSFELSTLQSQRISEGQTWIIVAFSAPLLGGVYWFLSKPKRQNSPQQYQHAQKNLRDKMRKKQKRAERTTG